MQWRVKPLEEILAAAQRKPLHPTLGAFQLMMLGVGAIIGTGIFVLTAEAAQKAGPGMMVSFVIAAFVCAVTALCYAELASMVPVSGSAYTYSYVVFGEIAAWVVGWALVLEYAIAGSAISVGWSNYFVGLAESILHLHLQEAFTKGPFTGGIINIPAAMISALVTALLYFGTRESAAVTSVLVVVKIFALTIFLAFAIPVVQLRHFEPFLPLGFSGAGTAAASIFFAYLGFDAVSTAAEETRDPQRNVPIGLIGSLVICTTLFLLVAAGAIGALGAQPIRVAGVALEPGTMEFADACKENANHAALVCSGEPLAFVLRQIGWPRIGDLIGVAAFLALPSVVLMMLFAQTRILFVMSRDGLLPARLSAIHTRFYTPHVVTLITGSLVTLLAALFPVGRLADLSNSGTLFAFLIVALGVVILRIRDPSRTRSFRTPLLWITAPAAMLGCAYLFSMLPLRAKLTFVAWTLLGLAVYALYGKKRGYAAKNGG